MALVMEKETQIGITLSQAYLKIENVSGSKENITLKLCTYVDKQASISGMDFIEQAFYDFIPSVDEESPNFIKQGYEYLKARTEFKNAIDDLED